MREEWQGQADERMVIPEGVCNASTEERQQDTCVAGLTDLNYKATSVPANTDRAIRKCMSAMAGLREETVSSNFLRRSTNDYNQFASQTTLHCIPGQRGHLHLSVQVLEGQPA